MPHDGMNARMCEKFEHQCIFPRFRGFRMFRVHQTGTTTGTFSVCLFSSSNWYSFRNSDDYWQVYIPTSKARTVSCLERKRWRANHCCCDGASKGMEEACIASAIDRDSWLCNCYGHCIYQNFHAAGGREPGRKNQEYQTSRALLGNTTKSHKGRSRKPSHT